jgi:hypothetical protein
VNQVLNPLAYARGTFDQLYGGALRAFSAQVADANPPVERVYGPELAQVAYRNHALQNRVETTYGYNPLELSRYADYVSASSPNPKLLPGLAADHRLGDSQALTNNPGALPLAYFPSRVRSTSDGASADAGLVELDPAEVTLVTGPAPAVESDPSARVRVLERADGLLAVAYRSASANLLRVAIPFYPGWHARLNGNELPVLAVDGAFTGVVVPSGQGEVRLSYASKWLGAGAALSGLALAAVLAVFLSQRRDSSAKVEAC